jgi:hypothetical protein
MLHHVLPHLEQSRQIAHSVGVIAAFHFVFDLCLNPCKGHLRHNVTP